MIQPGDIILYPVVPNSWWLSKAIGEAQFIMGMNRKEAQYSHVEVYLGDNRTVGARWPMVDRYEMDISRPLEIWRINEITERQIQMGLVWLQSQQGEWYDFIALFTAGWIQINHEQVCSTLAAGYVKATGIIKSIPKFTTPDEMLHLVSMKKVEEY